MAQTDFTYAVARIRFKETNLLTDNELEGLLTAKNSDEVVRILKDKGWGDSAKDESLDQLISSEENKLWTFVNEIVPDKSVYAFLLVENDFHNLKVAVKAVTRDEKCDGMLIQNAVTKPSLIVDAVSKREYDRLPDYLSDVCQEAMSVLLQTSDGQLCDIIVDKGCLDYIYQLKSESDNDIVRLYCEQLVASSDIKIAVRCAKTKKPLDFIKRSLADCDTLNVDKLAVCASHGYDEIIEYLRETDYKSACDALEVSLSAFEKWCDDYMTEVLRPQKWEPFSIGPVIGYIVAKKSEIKAVRMILSAKVNDLDSDVIRERLRKSYV
ncbi:MAG: V-type ATPase subunit [Ruminococcus sp.]|nr:V-type ATPase subunit [Ruminococcus sp.]